MSYFAKLLQSSGATIGDRNASTLAIASPANFVGAHANAVGHPGEEQPAIRELHDERVLPVADSDSGRDLDRIAPARARSTLADDDAMAEPHPVRHAGGDPGVFELYSASSRAATLDGADRPRREPGRVGNTPESLASSIDATTRIDTALPIELSTYQLPIALDSLPLPSHSKNTTMARAMAEVRKWTSQTPAPSELSRIDDLALATIEIPSGIRSIDARPVASRDAALPELHVSIGSIEVVVEEAPTTQTPASRTANAPAVASTSSSSRRLARHHLRG